MKKQKYISPLLAICLAVIAAVLPMLTVARAYAPEDYDFSRPHSSHNVTLDSAELLSRALSMPLSEEEREYLALHGGLTLSYNSAIPTSLILTEYDNGELRIIASEYSYIAQCGSEVSWIPVTANIGDISLPLVKTNEGYIADFFGISEEDGTAVEISYELSLNIKSSDLNSVVNKAFADAPALKAQLEQRNAEYNELKAKYDMDLISYNEYLARLSEYELEYAEYTEYLSKKKVYEDALYEYNQYLAELAAYNKAVDEYNAYDSKLKAYNDAYALYREYLNELEEYARKQVLYQEYLGKLEFISGQLAVVKAAKTPMTDGRTAYAAIMGSLVTEVLENKHLFTGDMFGADEAVIDMAGASTENLRVLLSYYFSLDNDIDRYAYYSINYEAFRDNFVRLLQALDELYRNDRIRGAIIAEGKNRKYIILVAQLALISNGLTDGKVYGYSGSYVIDNNYKVDGNTVASLLGNKEYFKDTDTAVPLETGYPAAVAKPTLPKEVKEPVKPTPVSIPAYPDEVQKPTDEPAPVAKPTEPIQVADPGEPPKKYVPSEEISGIIMAYDNGELRQRAPFTSDYTLTLNKTVSKQVFNSQVITVVFYSYDGTELYRTEGDIGSCIDYLGAPPVREENAAASYTFLGWTDNEQSGELYDLSHIDGEATVYLHPVFIANTKYYTVTFSVDGVLTEQVLPYGAIPIFNGVPSKAADSDSDYEFLGWDSEISAVCSDKTYRAVFKNNYIVSSLEGSVGASVVSGGDYLVADCTAIGASALDVKGILRRAAASGKGIRLITVQADITISYTNAKAMLENGEDIIEIRVAQVGSSGYRYRVSVLNDDSSAVTNIYKLSVRVPCILTELNHMRLYYTDKSGERVYVGYSTDDGAASFNLSTGIDYRLFAEYTVSVIPSKLGTLYLDTLLCPEGSIVNVKAQLPKGVQLEKIYIVLPDGTEQTVTDGYFRMPKGDILIGIQAKQIEYTITFVNEGKVLATYIYHYGDTVVPPAPPSKVDTDKYGFSFKAWSPDIVTVTGDATYVAEYKTILLPPKKEPEGLQISPKILGLIVAAIVAGAMIVLVVIPSSVMSAILVARAKKQYIKKPKNREKDK